MAKQVKPVSVKAQKKVNIQEVVSLETPLMENIKSEKSEVVKEVRENSKGLTIIIKPLNDKQWSTRRGDKIVRKPVGIPALIDPETFKFAVDLSVIDTQHSKYKNIDLSLEFIRGEAHPTWESKRFKLMVKTSGTVLNTNRVDDSILYGIARGSSLVANSQDEYERGLWPEAEFVIFNEKETLKKAASNISMRNNLIRKSSSLPEEVKSYIILIVSGLDVSKSSSDVRIKAFDEAIEKEPGTVNRLITQDRTLLRVEAVIRRCLMKQILTKRGDQIRYFDVILGESMTQAIKYLNDVDQSEFLRDLTIKLDSE